MTANERLRQFDAQLKSTLAPLLAQQGFERAGRRRLWARPSKTSPGASQLVWVQVGEAASLQAGKFTVEFGVYYPQYDRFANGRRLKGPDIGACHLDMRERLGVLMQPSLDRWWSYADAEEKVAEQLAVIARLVNDLGLPWLSGTDTAANATLYDTGKLPEPDRLRRAAYERQRAGRLDC